MTGEPPIFSAGNLVWGNHISGFSGTAYNFKGANGTDCYYAQAAGESASGAPCPQILPFMMSPDPGSQLSSTSVTFTWSSGPGVQGYDLCVGSTNGKCDLFQKESATDLSMPVNLPDVDATIYLRLYFKIDGAWNFRSYTYGVHDAARFDRF